ncbi:MAG: putative selenium-dependent hydroxylase accessory protein YqeC [Burkholderiaceae bacterium]|nr:putative selenium-dependent hydroxylase accessory protein YqeC [Burkholderiaceae bacterium]
MTLIDSLGLATARVICLCGAGGKTTLMFALADEFVAAGERVLMTTTTKMAAQQMSGRWPGRQAENAQAISAIARPGAGAFIAYRELDKARAKVIGYAPEVVDQLAGSGLFTRIIVEADGSAHRPLKAPASYEPVFPASADAVLIVLGASGFGRPLGDETVFRFAIWSELTRLAPGEPVSAESVAAMVAHPQGLARTAPPGAARALFINQADDTTRLEIARRTLECLATASGNRPARAAIGRLLPSVQVLHETRYE